MEDSEKKDNAETINRHLHQSLLEMAELIENIHELQIELTKMQKEYAALP